MSGARRRELAARVLVVLASVSLAAAVVVGYAKRSVFDSDQFSNRASQALEDPGLRRLVAERLTDDVVLSAESRLTTARPLIQAGAEGVVGSTAFRRVFRGGVRDVHRAVFDRDRNTVTLAVADAGVLLGQAVQTLNPAVARRVRAVHRAELIDEHLGATAGLARLAERVRWLAVLLWVLTVALWAAAVGVSPQRRVALTRLGLGAIAVGVTLVVLLLIAHAVAFSRLEGSDARVAAQAVWDAFLADLRNAALVVAGCGAVVAAAASSLIRPVEVEEPVRRAASAAVRLITTEPATPGLAAIRGVGLIAAGLLVIAQRDAVVALALTVAGIYVVFRGVEALLRLVAQPAEQTPGPASPGAPRRGGRRRALAAGGLAALLAGGAVAAFVGTGGTSEAAPRVDTCNGHRELCGRPLDRVVLPATHNSMSGPLPGFFASEQDRPIAGQLKDGIRGLLIDTHYGDKLRNGRVRTELEGPIAKERRGYADQVGPRAVEAALRTRDRLGFAGKGERGIYLCHTFCELGAVRFDSVLRDLHDFLVANPNEVVVIVNQDAITPGDVEKQFSKADLDQFVYRGSTTKWPTLREMIDSDQRLVVFAEEDAGKSPWYRLAYRSAVQETPYDFKKVAKLTRPGELAASCRPNRGPRSAPLFLINHWINTDPAPLPGNAARVNASEPLLARARRCRELRHHLPNLIAVNFYKRGDLFGVVDELNGVGR